MVDPVTQMKALAKKMRFENEPIEKIVFYTTLLITVMDYFFMCETSP